MNRRSLGFARDDKGKGDSSLESVCWAEDMKMVGSAALPFVIPSEAEGSAVLHQVARSISAWLK
jgi:hypothetical protein